MHMAKLWANRQLAEVQLELAVDRVRQQQRRRRRRWRSRRRLQKKGHKIELRLFMLPDISPHLKGRRRSS